MTATLFDSPRPIIERPTLGENATRVWTVLRNAGATTEAHAMTDAEIAAAANLHKRVVIEAADELCAAGILVVANSRSGRWIGSVQEAIRYVEELKNRFRNSWARVRNVRRGIALHQRQLSLFNQEPQP